MNQTLRNIAERYSCRDFAGTPLTEGQIEAIIDAALAAPSAMNLQPWHLVVIKDKELVDELDAEGMKILADSEDKAFYERMMERGGRIFYNAPFMMLILSDGSKWGLLDSGILCQNVVLAAEAQGLKSCIVGMAGIPLDGPRKDEFAKRLRFPDGYKFAVGVIVGHLGDGGKKDPHTLDRSRVTVV